MLIQDYQSLQQGISDYAHRADLANNVYSDYFIQAAQTKLAHDIIQKNFGNGIKAMEVAMIPTAIAGGTLPVPTDYYTPKAFQINDGGGNSGTLIFKDPQWIYDAYPLRQAQGIPAFMGRDVMAAASFTASLAGNVLTVASMTSGVIQTGMILADPSGFLPANSTVVGFITGTGGVGTYTLNTSATINIEGMTGGGSVFIFGPYPDNAYVVQGTYYSRGTPLSNANPTNWMVLAQPYALHAGCMIEAGKFLKDLTMVQTWAPVYEDLVQGLIDKDKGERFSSATMFISLG